ncbi:hypothetical protein JOD20_001463 [Herpetosiphon giganteus]|nr:hypothetical protein [Herpetosiphon giganteus]
MKDEKIRNAIGYWLLAIGTLFIQFVELVAKKINFASFARFVVSSLCVPSCPSWINLRKAMGYAILGSGLKAMGC